MKIKSLIVIIIAIIPFIIGVYLNINFVKCVNNDRLALSSNSIFKDQNIDDHCSSNFLPLSLGYVSFAAYENNSAVLGIAFLNLCLFTLVSYLLWYSLSYKKYYIILILIFCYALSMGMETVAKIIGHIN